MPKIVRNEIEYSSTTSTANQINYLNTTSGLSATNVQDAIDEIVQANDSSLLFKPTVTEPTLVNGTNHNHRTYYYKHGTRVCLSLGVSGLTMGLSGRQLFTLPVGYRPRLSLSMICCGYSFDKLSAVQILDNGNVVVQYTQDQGCFAYIEFDAYS